MDTALQPERPVSAASSVGGRGAGGGGGEGGSPVKIALFSLGNMCAHRECRESLIHLGVHDMIKRLGGSTDPETLKYIQRIQTKLQAAEARAGA